MINYSFTPQTNGTSNGLVPMLRVYNNTARYFDQGGKKVNFAFQYFIFFISLMEMLIISISSYLIYSLRLYYIIV